MNLASSSPRSTTTAASVPSKRHSLSIYPTSGPRPLQLLNGVATTTTTTTTIPATSSVAPTSPPSHVQLRPSTPNNFTFSPSDLLRDEPLEVPAGRNLRRHSSISYRRSGYDNGQAAGSENDAPFSSPSPAPHPKTRPRSVIYSTNPVSGLNNMGGSPVGERPPLTLVEKHADLLRFIAQKESKCLELRSQLATHEAELLQLKRKWERIISRSFEPPLSASSLSPTSTLASPSPSQALFSISSSKTNTPQTTTCTSSTAPSTPSSSIAGSVIGGIKEGVQGMGRLITTGFTSPADLHPHHPHQRYPTSPLSQSRNSSTPNMTPATSSPSPKPRPQSLYSQYPYSHIRSANLSISSASTNATGTTTTTARSSVSRFSAASFESASSFFEEADPTGEEDDTQKQSVSPSSSPGQKSPEAVRNQEVGESSMSSLDSSELIVRDTGATPVVSPNPKFRLKISRRRERERKGKSGSEDLGPKEINDDNAERNYGFFIPEPAATTEPNVEREAEEGRGNSSAISRSNSRCHRRKSRDVSALHLHLSLDGVNLGDPSNPQLDSVSDSILKLSSSGLKSGPNADPHFDLGQQPRTAPSANPPHPPIASSKRSSLVGMLAPASTIPGLNLAESAAMLINGGTCGAGEVETHLPSQTQHPPPSSWMGKKWESFGFQRSTISKSKSASLLLNDVSQTLANAFSLSAAVGASVPPSASSESGFAPPLASKPRAELASLLDQDDDVSDVTKQPMKPTVIIRRPNNGKLNLEPRYHAGVRRDEGGDYEWNW